MTDTTESIVAELKQQLKDANALESIMIDHEPIQLRHVGLGEWFTVSLSPLDDDNLDFFGKMAVDNNDFLVYSQIQNRNTTTNFVKFNPKDIQQAEVKPWDKYLSSPTVDYKFNEGELLQEIKAYIDSTYQQHYSGKIQATDMIIDAGHGIGFCIGNIMKYAKRLGKKKGYNPDDVMKIIHYSIILQHVLTLENGEE